MAISQFPYEFLRDQLNIKVLLGDNDSWIFEVSDSTGFLYKINWKPSHEEYITLNVKRIEAETLQMHQIKQAFWLKYND